MTSPSPQYSPLTRHGTVIGTVQYMSPEQIQGSEADARSDIFAFGAVLYEMATSKRPFEGKSQIKVASAILEDEPQPVSAVLKTSPPALDRLVRSCLAKSPDERFQSALDVKLELKWLSTAQPGTVPAGPKLASWVAYLALAAIAVRAPVVDPEIPAFADTKGPRSRIVKLERPLRVVTFDAHEASGTSIHPAARKLLTALVQHAPSRFTWGQAATLAGLKPSGGHFNSGRKDLRAAGYVTETNGLVTPTPVGLKAAGEVPPAPSTPADRLALWCSRLPAPAPEMLRTLAAQGERYMDADELAAILGKKPSGGHWNSGIAVLRNNGLIEIDGRRYRPTNLFRE